MNGNDDIDQATLDFDPLGMPAGEQVAGEQHRQLAQALLVQAANIYTGIGEGHRRAAEACLAECKSELSTCHDCVRGFILRYLDEASKTYIKLREKVRRNITNLRDEAIYHGRQAYGRALVNAGAIEPTGVIPESSQLDLSQGPIDPASAGEAFRQRAQAIDLTGGLTRDDEVIPVRPGSIFEGLPGGLVMTPPVMTAPTRGNASDFPLSLGGIELPGDSPTISGSGTSAGGGHSTGGGSTGGGGAGADSCANNVFVPTPFTKGMKVHHTQTEDPERTLVVFYSPDPNNPEGFQYIAKCPAGRAFINYATDGSGFTCGPCSPTSPTPPTTPPAGGASPGACCCDTGPNFLPAPPIDPDPPGDDSAGQTCSAPDSPIYGLGSDSAGNPSANASTASITFNGDGTLNFATDWGLKGGLLESQLGFPLGVASGKWQSSPIVTREGKPAWLFTDPATGATLLSNTKIDPTKLQVGNTATAAGCAGGAAASHSVSFWGDYCNPEELDRFKSAFTSTASDLASSPNDWFWEKVKPELPNTTGLGKPSGIMEGTFLRIGVALLGLTVTMPFAVVKKVFEYIPKPTNCNKPAFGSLWVLSAFANFAGRWLGIVPQSIATYLEYLMNYACQYKLPSAQDANAARRVDRLTKDEWESLIKFNAECPEWQSKLVEAGRPQPSLMQVFGLYQAEMITSDDFQTLAKRTGVDIDDDLPHWNLLVEQLPGPSDLMRFMVRDVADESVVTSQKLDEDFDKKWAGKLKEWGQRQNITDDIARYTWYAHWQYPAIGQVFETLHRLRPDANVTTPDGKPVSVTLDDARELLKINDLAPAWVDRMIATSYRIIPFRQVKVQYETGVFDEEDLVDKYQDVGYDKELAQKLADSTVIQSADRRAAFQGNIPPSELSKLYRADAISKNDYFVGLNEAGLKPDIVNARIESDDQRKHAADQKVKLTAMRRAFLKGAIDEGEYRNALGNLDIEESRIVEITRRDRITMFAGSREISAAKVCKLIDQGFLSIGDGVDRMQNLGYSTKEAALMIQSCVADIAKARAAANEAQARKLQADAEKEERKKKTKLREDRKAYMENLPCKPGPKITCPPGVRFPPAI